MHAREKKILKVRNCVSDTCECLCEKVQILREKISPYPGEGPI